MRITEIRAYQVDLPLHEGAYKWSGGNAVQVFDSTIVEILTDSGAIGYGEVCPLGPAYLPAYAAGARTGIAELAPSLIGADPTQLGVLNERMDRAMRGHPVREVRDGYGLLGYPRQSLRPIRHNSARRKLLRGFSLLPRDLAGHSRKNGRQRRRNIAPRDITNFSSKSAAIPIRMSSASAMFPRSSNPATCSSPTRIPAGRSIRRLRVAAAVRDVDVYIEQPCTTYEECLAVRRHTNRPFILDEVMDSLAMVVRGYADQAMDVINLKISKVGGLTRARGRSAICAFRSASRSQLKIHGAVTSPQRRSRTWRKARRRKCCSPPPTSIATSP